MPRPRCVVPEALDELAPDDPHAQRSRRDLQRIHRVMGSIAWLKRAIARLPMSRPPKTVLELGAGDGSLLLRLARAIQPQWRGIRVTLLDRHPCVDAQTLQSFREVGWHASVVCEDALEWARSSAAPRYDLCIASLFLHHFQGSALDGLLNGMARRSDAAIAIEPRRDALSLAGSRLVALLGANAITRGDAVKSVEAGFAATEIGERWRANGGDWWTDEFRAWPFSHAFLAVRRPAPGGAER